MLKSMHVTPEFRVQGFLGKELRVNDIFSQGTRLITALTRVSNHKRGIFVVIYRRRRALLL